jgi:hypothetical protein
MHLARCQHWLKTPPPDNWDGAWTLTEKWDIAKSRQLKSGQLLVKSAHF